MPRKLSEADTARSGFTLNLRLEHAALVEQLTEIKPCDRAIANRIRRRTAGKQCFDSCVDLCQ